MIGQIDKEYIHTRFWKLYSRFVSYAFFEGRPLTTKGRWFNKVVFFILKVAKLSPFKKKVKQPIFILGTGRSGTTILGIVLSMHKDVGFLNEPKALWHSINPHEDLVGSYTMEEAFYSLDASHCDEKQIDNIHKIFGAYLFVTFSKRIVDKYPELIFRIPYVKALFPDAKFLFLVRNGWDTCASIEKWSQRLATSTELETQDWWGRDNRKWNLLIEQVIKYDSYYENIMPVISDIKKHTDMAALEWIATMRQGLKALNEYPQSILRINYENLVENAELELIEIKEFCHLDSDNVFIDYGVKILKPAQEKEPFELHPMIRPLFIETMNTLGYKTNEKKETQKNT